MEFANNVAKISWNDAEARFELHILNKLKAHSKADNGGSTKEDHAEGKAELIQLAKDKGYTVIEN